MYLRLIKDIKQKLIKNRSAKIAILIISIFVIASILAFLSPYDPNLIQIKDRLKTPSLKHIFGTDLVGRDYFTRILYGGRVSLSVGFLSMIISTSLGTFVGAICGYYEGILDSVVMRIIDILMCVPSFFIILVLNAYLKPSMTTIIFVIGFLGWMGTARIVRAETLSLKNREYVLYAKNLGMKDLKIIKKHILPSILPVILVVATMSIAGAILTESALSFLGMGIQAPQASWGSMLSKAQKYIGSNPYLCIFPGFAILMTVLSFNILGDIIGQIMDKRRT